MVPKPQYKFIILIFIIAPLVTFMSIWMPNLVQTGFCLSQLQKIEEGEAGNRWSVEVMSVGFQRGQRWGGMELEAFIPYSNFPA